MKAYDFCEMRGKAATDGSSYMFWDFSKSDAAKNTSQAKCTERVQNLSKSDLFRNLLGCILKDFQIVWGVELSDRHQRFFVDFDGAR